MMTGQCGVGKRKSCMQRVPHYSRGQGEGGSSVRLGQGDAMHATRARASMRSRLTNVLAHTLARITSAHP